MTRERPLVILPRQGHDQMSSPDNIHDSLALPVRAGDGLQPQASVAATFRAYLLEKDRFCDRLETVADLLPDGVDPRDCLLLAQNIVPLVKRAHQFEENTVFPLLLADRNMPEELKDSLDRLKFEHLGDEEFANDLCLSLREFVTNRPGANIESLAWMLRGFFEGLRRHVAFERVHLLPLVERLQASRAV